MLRYLFCSLARCLDLLTGHGLIRHANPRRAKGATHAIQWRGRMPTHCTPGLLEPQGRRRTTERWFLIVLAVLAASPSMGTSLLPSTIEDSLEWTTRNSELIVLGRPLQVNQDVHDENSRWPPVQFEEHVTISVDRVLLGVSHSPSLAFRWSTDRSHTMQYEVDLTNEKNVTYDRPQLFFLNRAGGPGPASPTAWRLRRSIFVKQSSQGLRTATGELVKTADGIIGVVEKEISELNTIPISRGNETGSDTFIRSKTLAQGPSYYASPKGSVLLLVAPREYVIAPAYLRFREHALTLCRSSDSQDRERGAYMLRSYSDDASVKMLTALLTDESAYLWNMTPTQACAVYMVRVAAYDTLRDLGHEPKVPVQLEECQNHR